MKTKIFKTSFPNKMKLNSDIKDLKSDKKSKINNNIDIKYKNIPNICFSLTDKNDKREPKFIKQRLLRGFDDSETWSLDSTIAKFITPRLERYIEIVNQNIERPEEEILLTNKFLTAMKLISDSDGGDSDFFTEEQKIILKEGLEAFPKIFEKLWW